MYQTIRRQAPEALSKFLRYPLRPRDERLFKEYFCRTLLDISQCEDAAKLKYYKKILVSILWRNVASKRDVKLIKRLLKFCSRHPIEAAGYVMDISSDLKAMLGIDASAL